MPSGKSLYIGLNAVDPKQYSGWSGELSGCEFDAKDMRTIAKKHGFATTLRLTKSATRNKILGDLKRAAKKLRRAGQRIPQSAPGRRLVQRITNSR